MRTRRDCYWPVTVNLTNDRSSGTSSSVEVRMVTAEAQSRRVVEVIGHLPKGLSFAEIAPQAVRYTNAGTGSSKCAASTG